MRTIRDEDGSVYVPIYFDNITSETNLAICFSVDGKKFWLPKDLIFNLDRAENELIISERLAVEKGMVNNG